MAVGVGGIVAVGDAVRAGDGVPQAPSRSPNTTIPTPTIPAARLVISCSPSSLSGRARARKASLTWSIALCTPAPRDFPAMECTHHAREVSTHRAIGGTQRVVCEVKVGAEIVVYRGAAVIALSYFHRHYLDGRLHRVGA